MQTQQLTPTVPDVSEIYNKLSAALRNNRLKDELNLLIKTYGNIFKNEKQILTILHFLPTLAREDTYTILEGIVEYIRDNNMDLVSLVNQKARGGSPLNYACHTGNTKFARYFLNLGSQPNAEALCLLLYIGKGPGLVSDVYTLYFEHKIKDTKGIVATVKAFIEHGLDVNDKNEKGVTPLHVAAEYGNAEIVKILLAANANPNTFCPGYDSSSATLRTNRKGEPATTGETPLTIACRTGLVGLVQEFLKYKIPQPKVELEPLYIACQMGHIILTKYLVKIGINSELSALHLATKFGQIELVKSILKEDKQDLNLVKNNQTVLMLALETSPQKRTELLNVLLAAGADIDLGDDDNTTPLHIGALLNDKEIVKYLLQNKANPNAVTKKEGKTPLLIACQHCYIQIAGTLITAGSDVNIRDKHGFTVLAEACRDGSKDVFDLLMRNNANVNIKSDKGETPLALACMRDDKKMMLRLMAVDASIEDCFRYLLSVELTKKLSLLLEVANNQKKLTATVLTTLLCTACEYNEPAVIDILIFKYKAKINRMNSEGHTPFQYAFQNNLTMAKHLIKNETFDINHEIQLAASTKNFQAIEFLLNQPGVDIARLLYNMCELGQVRIIQSILTNNSAIIDVNKAMHIACAHGHVALLPLLIQYGAKINFLSQKNGFTPLLVACQSGQVEVCAWLLQNQADPHLTSRDNDVSCISLARKHNFSVITQLLMDAGVGLLPEEKPVQAYFEERIPFYKIDAAIKGYKKAPRRVDKALEISKKEEETTPDKKNIEKNITWFDGRLTLKEVVEVVNGVNLYCYIPVEIKEKLQEKGYLQNFDSIFAVPKLDPFNGFQILDDKKGVFHPLNLQMGNYKYPESLRPEYEIKPQTLLDVLRVICVVCQSDSKSENEQGSVIVAVDITPPFHEKKDVNSYNDRLAALKSENKPFKFSLPSTNRLDEDKNENKKTEMPKKSKF